MRRILKIALNVLLSLCVLMVVAILIVTLYGDTIRWGLQTGEWPFLDKPRSLLDPIPKRSFSFGNLSRDTPTRRERLPTFGQAAAWRPDPTPLTRTREDALSTFPVDVDTESYERFRSRMSSGLPPQPHSVHVEEWVNAFRYGLPEPKEGDIHVDLEAAPSPFTPGRHLVKVGIQSRPLSRTQSTPAWELAPLEVLAEELKVQVEFDPDAVQGYRLFGDENPAGLQQRFRRNLDPGGEVVPGPSAIAFYEVELTSGGSWLAAVHVGVRKPGAAAFTEQRFTLERDAVHESLDDASSDMRFAAAVLLTAELLREAPGSHDGYLHTAESLAEDALDDEPEREEFLELLSEVRRLRASPDWVKKVNSY